MKVLERAGKLGNSGDPKDNRKGVPVCNEGAQARLSCILAWGGWYPVHWCTLYGFRWFFSGEWWGEVLGFSPLVRISKIWDRKVERICGGLTPKWLDSFGLRRGEMWVNEATCQPRDELIKSTEICSIDNLLMNAPHPSPSLPRRMHPLASVVFKQKLIQFSLN